MKGKRQQTETLTPESPNFYSLPPLPITFLGFLWGTSLPNWFDAWVQSFSIEILVGINDMKGNYNEVKDMKRKDDWTCSEMEGTQKNH